MLREAGKVRGGVRRRLSSGSSVQREWVVRCWRLRQVHRGVEERLLEFGEVSKEWFVLGASRKVRGARGRLRGVDDLSKARDVYSGGRGVPHQLRRGLRGFGAVQDDGLVYRAGRALHGSFEPRLQDVGSMPEAGVVPRRQGTMRALGVGSLWVVAL